LSAHAILNANHVPGVFPTNNQARQNQRYPSRVPWPGLHIIPSSEAEAEKLHMPNRVYATPA
jgi:hypothetical protein